MPAKIRLQSHRRSQAQGSPGPAGLGWWVGGRDWLPALEQRSAQGHGRGSEARQQERRLPRWGLGRRPSAQSPRWRSSPTKTAVSLARDRSPRWMKSHVGKGRTESLSKMRLPQPGPGTACVLLRPRGRRPLRPPSPSAAGRWTADCCSQALRRQRAVATMTLGIVVDASSSSAELYWPGRAETRRVKGGNSRRGDEGQRGHGGHLLLWAGGWGHHRASCTGPPGLELPLRAKPRD